jgi:hypothetical protein
VLPEHFGAFSSNAINVKESGFERARAVTKSQPFRRRQIASAAGRGGFLQLVVVGDQDKPILLLMHKVIMSRKQAPARLDRF